MEHHDFKIGIEFTTETGRWRCTDVRTRTIIAIKISDYVEPRGSMDHPMQSLNMPLTNMICRAASQCEL